MLRRGARPRSACPGMAIGSVRPHGGAGFNAHLFEERRVGPERLEDGPNHQPCDISLNNRAVAECKPQPPSFERDCLPN